MRGTKGLRGEGDPSSMAEADEVPVHELTAIVSMERDDLPRVPMETVHVPLCCQKPPDRGRTHPEEQLSCFLIHVEMSVHREVLHEEGHASCQTDRSQERAGCPDTDQCLLHIGAIPRRTISVDALARISHQDGLSYDVSLSCLAQDTGGIRPLVSRRFTEVVQHG